MASQEEDSKPTENMPAQKEKLRSIMEAASALTSLGDEESETGSRPSSPTCKNEEEPKESATKETVVHEEDATEGKQGETKETSAKRFLPEHKKPDAAPTFPEKLMKMMRYVEEHGKDKPDYCISWLPDGKSFVIRNPDEFTRSIVPQFFKATKFSSFTRKLYRWGFRQINRGIGPDDPIIFGNEHFDRDNEHLMAGMRSVTAAGTRKAEQHRSVNMYGGMKRPMDDIYGTSDPNKRMFFDHYFQQQKMMQQQHPPMYPGNGTMPLSNALRPTMPMHDGQGSYPGNKPYEMQPQGHHPGMHPGMMHPSQYHGMQPMPYGNGPPPHQQYPNAQSTAEIVNAAIAALRHAN